AALALMIIPAVGSVYPVPPAPVSYFPYVFLAYVVSGVVRVGTMTGHRSKATRVKEIALEVKRHHVDAQPQSACVRLCNGKLKSCRVEQPAAAVMRHVRNTER